MKDYHVYGIGNALVDTEYEVDENFLTAFSIDKGMMTLIDEQTRHDMALKLDQRFTAKKHTSGGSAANTIVALAQFGGKAFYSCKVADDEIGNFYMNDLQELGIMTNLSSNKQKGVTGQCLVMITPDAERTMTTYLGISQNISETEIDEAALRASEYLYIEGYLASSESGRQAAIKARQIAVDAGVKVSLTLSDPAMVENFKSTFHDIMGDKIDLIFCNKDEALIWSGESTIEAAAEALKQNTKAFAITLGHEGALVYDGEQLQLVPTENAMAVDSNGAGDMFAGAFLYGLTHGYSFLDAATLANKSAARLVTQFGARMDSKTQKSLLPL